MQLIESIVSRHLLPTDNFIHGYADLTGLLDKQFEGYDYGISIGRKLDDKIVDKITDGPTEEYYAHYLEINKLLEKLTQKISRELNASGIDSINIEPTISTDDLETKYSDSLQAELSHKMVATRAGLGWIGKTDLFVSKKIGPRLRLVSILVKTPVKSLSAPVETSRCGKCDLCVKICPVNAGNGKLWNINIRREEFFDPWRCREQCTEFGRLRLEGGARICGMCMAICPVGRKQ